MDQQDLVRKIAGLWRQVHKTLEERGPSPWLRLNLTRGQLRILFLLSTQGQMTPGVVAAALGVPKANVTSVIDRLVQQGLVNRQHDAKDRRSYILCLTEKGQDEVAQLREWFATRIERVLIGMRNEELGNLASSLEAMLKAAQQTGKTASQESA